MLPLLRTGQDVIEGWKSGQGLIPVIPAKVRIRGFDDSKRGIPAVSGMTQVPQIPRLRPNVPQTPALILSRSRARKAQEWRARQHQEPRTQQSET